MTIKIITKRIYKLLENNLLVFLLFAALVFILYFPLFNSYFEADEWFHFTHYLPLTRNPLGALIAVTKSVTGAQALSDGQHVVPIGEEIFFLNTLFFGLNFKPYAFMSMFFHALNSFLVFLLIKNLLFKAKGEGKKIFAALVGGLFFAFSSAPMHVVTWAAFYGQNILSVTFFILTLLFLVEGINTKEKKYLFFSSFFLLLDLLTKETAAMLIFIIPLIVYFNRNTFKLTYLLKVFSFPLAIFIPFRFLLPALYLWINDWIADSFNLTNQASLSPAASSSLDLWLILYRIVTFPLSMLSRIYIPSDTILNFMKIIAPLIYFQYPNEGDIRVQYRQFFVNGPGNNLFFYLAAFIIVLITFFLIRNFIKKKRIEEAKVIFIGFSIIVVGALPLVLNVLYLPWWGTDYFDSRHYYMPSVGAAILLPFLFLFLAEKVSGLVKLTLRISVSVYFIAALFFLIWFFNNMQIFQKNLNTIIDITGAPRREIITQMKDIVPVLPEKAVIYAETDGGGAYGTILPFQTSFPQILTVVYYDKKNPLPNSFYDTFFLDAKPEGYFYSEGRGLGYYNTKKTLSEELLKNKFSVDDIYAFYYDSKNIKIRDITNDIRDEMSQFLKTAKNTSDWGRFEDPVLKLSFRYPPNVQVNNASAFDLESGVLGEFEFSGIVNGKMKVINFPPALDIIQFYELSNKLENSSSVLQEKLFFDKFHFNESTVIMSLNKRGYIIKLKDKLVYFSTSYANDSETEVIEKMLGSLIISDQ